MNDLPKTDPKPDKASKEARLAELQKKIDDLVKERQKIMEET